MLCISCNISLFSIYRITASTFLSYTYRLLLRFVLLCICRGRAYETLISYCLLFHFELPQRCSTLTKIKYQRKKTESVEKEEWEEWGGREKNRSKKTDALDTENLFFVWIQMKWITFVHVLIKSFLTCYIFYARFFYIYIMLNSPPNTSIVRLCGVPFQIVYVPYNFYLLWNVLLLFNIPVPLISPKNHTIIKRTHSEIKLLLLNNNVIWTENIALIYVLHGGCVCVCATIRLWWLWCWA